MEAAVIVLQYSDVPDQHTGVSPIAHKVQLLSVNTWVAVAGLSFVSLLSAHLASLLGCVWSVVFIFNFKTRQKKSIKPKLLIFSKYINNNNIHWAHYRSQQPSHKNTKQRMSHETKKKQSKKHENQPEHKTKYSHDQTKTIILHYGTPNPVERVGSTLP